MNVKLLHNIKCCFFSNFSIVRWDWKIKKIFGPQEKVEMTPLFWAGYKSGQICLHIRIRVNDSVGQVTRVQEKWPVEKLFSVNRRPPSFKFAANTFIAFVCQFYQN